MQLFVRHSFARTAGFYSWYYFARFSGACGRGRC